LGEWARYLQGFVNGTKLRLEGDEDANFSGFIPESANWGLNLRWKRVEAILNWNYRGQQRRQALPAVNGYEYIMARTTLDVSMGFRLTKRLSLYGNAQNVFNKPETAHRYGPETPEYAKHHREVKHGGQITMGVKGTF